VYALSMQQNQMRFTIKIKVICTILLENQSS